MKYKKSFLLASLLWIGGGHICAHAIQKVVVVKRNQQNGQYSSHNNKQPHNIAKSVEMLDKVLSKTLPNSNVAQLKKNNAEITVLITKGKGEQKDNILLTYPNKTFSGKGEKGDPLNQAVEDVYSLLPLDKLEVDEAVVNVQDVR